MENLDELLVTPLRIASGWCVVKNLMDDSLRQDIRSGLDLPDPVRDTLCILRYGRGIYAEIEYLKDGAEGGYRHFVSLFENQGSSFFMTCNSMEDAISLFELVLVSVALANGVPRTETLEELSARYGATLSRE